MIKICITGEMASGKSFCSKIFEQLGIPVFYTDDVSRVIVNTNQELKKEINESGLSNSQIKRLHAVLQQVLFVYLVLVALLTECKRKKYSIVIEDLLNSTC